MFIFLCSHLPALQGDSGSGRRAQLVGTLVIPANRYGFTYPGRYPTNAPIYCFIGFKFVIIFKTNYTHLKSYVRTSEYSIIDVGTYPGTYPERSLSIHQYTYARENCCYNTCLIASKLKKNFFKAHHIISNRYYLIFEFPLLDDGIYPGYILSILQYKYASETVFYTACRIAFIPEISLFKAHYIFSYSYDLTFELSLSDVGTYHYWCPTPVPITCLIHRTCTTYPVYIISMNLPRNFQLCGIFKLQKLLFTTQYIFLNNFSNFSRKIQNTTLIFHEFCTPVPITCLIHRTRTTYPVYIISMNLHRNFQHYGFFKLKKLLDNFLTED